MSERKSVRSDQYQHMFAERLIDPHALARMITKRGDQARPTAEQAEAEALALDELRLHLWRLIDCHLSSKQRAVARMLAAGMTQWEIATVLGGINQSSITKYIRGNPVYKSDRAVYQGGIIKRLNKIAARDPGIHVALKKLEETIETY